MKRTYSLSPRERVRVRGDRGKLIQAISSLFPLRFVRRGEKEKNFQPSPSLKVASRKVIA
jgi:hypothetical protein